MASGQPEEKVMSINPNTHGDPSSSTGGDGSQAAARLLELTAREADQWRADAKSEAAAIVAAARDEAAKVVRAARDEAERLVATAKEEGAQITNDARVEAYRVREETTALRKRQEEHVARLEQLATEQRELLRHHLTEMLGRVDSLSSGDSR
jgi:cell division septum initiation protein DivIVA